MQTINYCGICGDYQFKWIPVEERLPKIGEHVITVSCHDIIRIDWRWREQNGDWSYGKKVTHWMPLPPLPGEEGEK